MAGSGTTDVVLDVTGYFTALSGLAFYPLNPGRIMDTRPGVANSGLSRAVLGQYRPEPRDRRPLGRPDSTPGRSPAT